MVPVRNRVGDLDSLFTLNEVASRVWDLLDGQRSLDAIAETICAEFEVAPEVAAADIEELMRALEQVHLVELAEG
ncbi:MAG TPA: PqqD family protein [Thermoanaerobaculia bacterium]